LNKVNSLITLQQDLIKLLKSEILNLCIKHSTDLEKDAIDRIVSLEDQIETELKTYVPFISEVEEFNTTMGKPNNYEPVIPERKEWEFVYNFILEELEEYKEACETGNIVEVLDALSDITYVATGNGTLLHGLKDKIWEAYQEVHRSNMSKACSTEEEALETVKVRSQEQGEECHFEKVGNFYVVYRSRDRKVMKNVNYFRPNLKQFFNGTVTTGIKG